MNGVNKVILLGNLGADPEWKAMQSGDGVLKLRVATNTRYKDAQGEWKDRTEWHNVDVWGKRGEALSRLLSKGEPVYIEGELQTRSTDGQNGEKKYFTSVRANEVVLLGGRREDQQQQAPQGYPSQNQPAPYYPPQQPPPQHYHQQQPVPAQNQPAAAPPGTEFPYGYNAPIPR